MSKTPNQRTYISARWPLYLPFGLSQVVRGSLLIQDLIPSLPKVVSRPQNVISSESKIIKACESGNIPEIQQLLSYKRFHPNDRTPDDLTVFRFAVRSGNPEIVRLLLENGADPNLSFGKYETSPLNNAFFIGNVPIIRLLLDAGAELEYKNFRTWTSISYLWDPTPPAHATTTEIIEICASHGFSAWNDTTLVAGLLSIAPLRMDVARTFTT